MSLEETIDDLSDGDKPLLSSWLVYLSNLGSEEIAIFELAWAKVELERRRQTISRLVELAEDNFELNFEGVFRCCLKDEDAEVRCNAIEGLWESEETSLIKPLIDLLEQDSSESVQAAAAAALGKFAIMAELNKLRLCYVSQVGQALLMVINDKRRPVEVRRRALEAAAPLSLPEIANAITEAYYSDNPRLRTSAVYAMGKNCSPSWLPILLRELKSAEDEIRYEATGACGELGEEEAVPYLIELTDDTNTDIQQAAIQALGKIGGKDAKEHLEECLNHPGQIIREVAEAALDELEVEENPLSFRRII